MPKAQTPKTRTPYTRPANAEQEGPSLIQTQFFQMAQETVKAVEDTLDVLERGRENIERAVEIYQQEQGTTPSA